MRLRDLALGVALLCSASTPLLAQAATDATDVAGELKAFIEDPANDAKTYEDLLEKAEALLPAAQAGKAAAQASQPPAAAALALEDAATVAAAAPATTAAPDGFSTRVNDSLTNFLPLFGFAVNTISTAEDEKSVSVAYNPIRLGTRGVVSLSTTIAEPEASSKLLEQVAQSARASETEAIGNRLDDLSDLTFAGTYGYQRSDEGKVWDDGAHLWGRNPKLYQNLASELMASVWDKAFSARSFDAVGDTSEWEVKIVDRIPATNDDATAATMVELRKAFSAGELKQFVSALVADAISEAAFLAELRKYKLSHLAAMLANQPQVTITAAYRDRDPLIGGDETVVTGKLEIGSANLNRAMSHYKKTKRVKKAEGKTYSKLEAYEWAIEELKVQAQNRTSISVTYKERAAWNPSYAYTLEVPDPASGDVTTFDKVATLGVPSAQDWCIKASWSRTFRRSAGSVKSRGLVQRAAELGQLAGVSELADLGQAELDVPARIDLSLEYIDVDGDDPLTRDRGIARVSYALPLPGGLSLPFTLTYSNHSKFLGEQDDVLSTHIGLSYTLPGQ